MGQLVASGATVAGDDDGAVDLGGEQRCVRHGQQRGSVEYDDVKAVAQLPEQLLHGGRLEELRRVRWDRAAGQHLKAGVGVLEEGVVERDLADQNARGADGAIEAEAGGDEWAS